MFAAEAKKRQGMRTYLEGESIVTNLLECADEAGEESLEVINSLSRSCKSRQKISKKKPT